MAKLSRTTRRGALITRPLLQGLGLEVSPQAGDHVLQIAVEDAGEVVAGEPDAVVGQPILRKVVGADLLRAVTGADLAAARLALGGLALLLLDIEQLRPQELQDRKS